MMQRVNKFGSTESQTPAIEIVAHDLTHQANMVPIATRLGKEYLYLDILGESNVRSAHILNKQIQLHKKEREKEELEYVLSDLQPPSFHKVMASVRGPKGTPYEGGFFTFQIYFSENEYKPYTVVPVDVLPHPCIDYDKVGLELLLKKNCSYPKDINILCLMDMITLLIKKPEMGYPVDPPNLKLYLNNPEELEKNIREAVIEQNKR